MRGGSETSLLSPISFPSLTYLELYIALEMVEDDIVEDKCERQEQGLGNLLLVMMMHLHDSTKRSQSRMRRNICFEVILPTVTTATK